MTKNQIAGRGEWEPRQASFQAVRDSAISDSEICFLQSSFPSGVRDWVLHLRSDDGIQVINPIVLLGTDTACQLISRTHKLSPDLAHQFLLSRLLVQCLEYRGFSRHLVVEPWSERDLRGESFFENNRTQLAKDYSIEQAESFKLVMSGLREPARSAEELYWGTFSTLPKVEDSFEDEELKKLAEQLSGRLVVEGEGNAVVEIKAFKKRVNGFWSGYFADFELETPKRERRKLFARLMSVAVRQSSSLMRQIAYALLLKGMSQKDRDAFDFTPCEMALFEIRYGSHRPLGNINIGFLHEYDEHHADLLNELGRALVGDCQQKDIENAEKRLYRNVQLLDEFRLARKEIRADQRQTTRENKKKKAPKDAQWKQVEIEDTRTPKPDKRSILLELLEEVILVIDDLKPRCQKRIRILIEAGIDWERAAELSGVEERKFRRRFEETTFPNIQKAIRRKRQRGNS